jgi:sulfur dioxygenase
MLMRQLFDYETCSFTYLLGDEATGSAALIDPVAAQTDRDLQLLEELGLRLALVLETHVHTDHITGAGALRERTGARVLASPLGAACTDTKVTDGDVITLGSTPIRVLSTPGHTADSLSFTAERHAFTGDALLVRSTGRTDCQGGDAGALWTSITDVLFSLPDDTVIWPGHDFRGHTRSSVGEEKRHNPRIARKSKAEFLAFMAALQLPPPKFSHVTVPANSACGLSKVPPDQGAFGFRELSARQAMAYAAERQALIVDVREPDELTGELGRIPGALNVPRSEMVQAALDLALDAPVLIVCRSGRRSRAVCETLARRGFREVVNMAGGMLEYRENGGT